MPALPGTLRNDAHQPAVEASLQAATAWFAAGAGPLALYAGPALLLTAHHALVAANAAGEAVLPALLARLQLSGLDELAGAFALASPPTLQSSHLTGIDVGPVADPATRPISSKVYLDLDLLPCAGGVLLVGRDVSLERALRGALVESRQRLRDLVEIASDFTWETDSAGRFTMLSPQGVLGYSAVELIGRDPAELLMVPADADCFQGRRSSAEVWMRDAAGKPVCQHILALPLFDEMGQPRGARGLARDITEEKARSQDLAAARHRERLLVHFFRVLRQADNPREALAVALKTAVQAMGAAGAQLYRWHEGKPLLVLDQGEALAVEDWLESTPEQEAIQTEIDGQRALAMPCQRQGQRTGSLVLWRADDERAWDADDLFLLDELTDQLAVVIHQLTGHEELWRLSATDSLTGLLNRRGFVRALAPLLAVEAPLRDATGDAHPRGALIYIDLDNFKQLNDARGHATGDAALVATAELLRRWCRESDLLARLGGDEFVLWMAGMPAHLALERAAALLHMVQQSPFFAEVAPSETSRSETMGPRIGMSIGIASLPAHQVPTVDQLLQCADHAMYDSKRQGKGRVTLAVYDTAT